MIAPQTTLDVEREDEVSAVPEVARVDAAIGSVQAELTAARATLGAQAREAARALIAEKTPTSGVRDALTRIGELDAIIAGLAELHIIARYHGLEKLAADADKAAEELLAQAEAAKARQDAIMLGQVDLGPESQRSDIPKINALAVAEAEERGNSARQGAEREEAARLRSERSRLKRAHAALFSAEGIA